MKNTSIALLRSSSKIVKLATFSIAAVAGVSLISSSVFASLTATAFNTSAQSVSTSTLKLTQAQSGVAGLTAGFVSAVTAMAPGDTVNRFVDVSNIGTMAGQSMTLKVADSAATVLTTDAVNGLQVTVMECPVAYTTGTGLCSGTETTVVALTPANTLLTAKTATFASFAAGSTTRLKFIISLPAGSENTANGTLPTGTVQGLTSQLTWTFTEAQRTATNTVA